MQFHSGAFFIGLSILIIISAGCISDSPPALQKTTSLTANTAPENTSSTIEPADLGLQLSDLPSGFTVLESRDRSRSDLSTSVPDLNWIKGYHVMFSRQNESSLQLEYLTQDIDVFPLEKIKLALAQGNTEMLQRSEDAYLVDRLSDPKIGDSSQAYSLTLIKKSKKLGTATYFIQFVKRNVYEQIVIVSPMADIDSLEKIARTAAGKIT